jgi:putative membrane protein
MNLGITELVFVCGIVGLLLLFTAMVSGIGLRFLRRQENVPETQTPLNVLKMRYARGEITKQQFEDMKRDLQE